MSNGCPTKPWTSRSLTWTIPRTESSAPSHTGNRECGLSVIFRLISSGGSATSSQTTSFLGVISAAARLSPRRKTRLTISCSASSKTPAWAPSLTRALTSSSVTDDSADGRMRNSRRTSSVDPLRSRTTGTPTTDSIRSGLATMAAIRSGLLIASRLGTSSPKTREK